jgi:phenylalanyl-tRNA synthetase beta chain
VDGLEAVALLNPLSSTTDVLRNSLLFSGLEVLAYNLARNKKDALLFEFGTVYGKKVSTYFETKKLALWLTGETEACNWARRLGPIRLENVRHMVEQIAAKLGITSLTYAPVTHPCYEQAVQATHNGTNMVTFGSVHSSILQHFCIEQPVFTAAMNWKQLLAVQQVAPTYAPISKFPAVKRDLSLVLDQPVSFQSIKDLVQKQGYKTIRTMNLVDVYQGDQLPAGKKSYTIRFVLQDQTKTLEEKNIDKLMQQLMQVFERVLHAIIRR